jgi:hypothetical protein
VFPVRYELNSYILFGSVCVPYGSHNKQRLFPQTALTGWFFYVFCEVDTEFVSTV